MAGPPVVGVMGWTRRGARISVDELDHLDDGILVEVADGHAAGQDRGVEGLKELAGDVALAVSAAPAAPAAGSDEPFDDLLLTRRRLRMLRGRCRRWGVGGPRRRS